MTQANKPNDNKEGVKQIELPPKQMKQRIDEVAVYVLLNYEVHPNLAKRIYEAIWKFRDAYIADKHTDMLMNYIEVMTMYTYFRDMQR
jgi:hypothetical protein